MDKGNSLTLIPLLIFTSTLAIIVALFHDSDSGGLFYITSILISFCAAQLFYFGSFGKIMQGDASHLANIGVQMFFSLIAFIISIAAFYLSAVGSDRFAQVFCIVTISILALNEIVKRFVRQSLP